MPDARKGKNPPKPRKPPKDSSTRADAVLRQEAKEVEVGDTADQITRTPRKKR